MADTAGGAGAAAGTGGEGAAAAGATTGAEGQGQQAAGAAAGAAAGTGTEGQQATGTEGQEQQQTVDTSAWAPEAKDAYERQQREIERLRRERGDERIAAKAAARDEGKTEVQTALAKALAPLLGIELPGDGKDAPTVETLTAQAATIGSERDDARRESAAVQEAWKLGVDPTKLDFLQYKLSRDTKYAAADVTTDEGRATVKASIEAIVSADPTLKGAGTSAASGVEQLGGAGAGDAITPDAFAKMSLAERTALRHNDPETYKRLVG